MWSCEFDSAGLEQNPAGAFATGVLARPKEVLPLASVLGPCL